MKNKLIIFTVLTFILLPVTAQKVKDAIYLKNGSIIYGKLIEISEDQYKIRLADGSLLNYNSNEVSKFVKEIPGMQERKEDGPGFGIEAGLLIGSQSTEYSAPFSFNFSGSYTSNVKNIFSVGSGVEFLGVPYMPLFFEYKHLLRESRVTPFMFVRAGALMHIGDDEVGNSPYGQYNRHDFRGGFTGGFGTGVSWAKDEFEPFISFAYRYATTSYKQKDYNSVDSKFENKYNRLEIKFGMRF
jgi:hypothetical protein